MNSPEKPIERLRNHARAAGVSFSTIYRRMESLNISAAEAAALDHNKPYWMHRIEREEGDSVENILRAAAKVARTTGYTLLDHADEWGVPRETLRYWNNKWGIKWPRFKRKR